MGYKTTEISGKTYEYHSKNDGREYGDVDTPSLHEAIDYFHGDGRVALQLGRHAAFVSEGDSIHLHTLPKQDKQCPEDPHSCIMSWNIKQFEDMLNGLRVMAKGVEVEGEPKKILEMIDEHMDEYRYDSTNTDRQKDKVPRIN